MIARITRSAAVLGTIWMTGCTYKYYPAGDAVEATPRLVYVQPVQPVQLVAPAPPVATVVPDATPAAEPPPEAAAVSGPQEGDRRPGPTSVQEIVSPPQIVDK